MPGLSPKMQKGHFMKSLTVAAVAAALILPGCAGRKPNPVAEVQDGDAQLSCAQLAQEVQVNNRAILGLIGEQRKVEGNNVAAGVAGAIVFFPALFFMNVKGAAGEEARAYQRRNEGLIARYQGKGCKPEIKTASREDYEAALKAQEEKKE